MQTFLPDADFHISARWLDNKRLGKQRVETMQIMKVIYQKKVLGETKGAWFNHPAVLMWEDYPWALVQYQIAICAEWARRGCRDTCYDKTLKLYHKIPEDLQRKYEFPDWLDLDGKGNYEFHESHRSNLVRKDPEHYGKLWEDWLPEENLDYVWPILKKEF